MNDLVYKDKEIKIFNVQSELKNYNHKGVPYSNSLFAWEDNYNIEFNNNMYYIKLKTYYSFINSNFQFSLFFDTLPHLKRWGIPTSLTVAYAVKPHEVWRSHTFLRLTQSP